MSLISSYCPNYFSIEDIIATQERIPVKFLLDLPGLGKLDSSEQSNDLKAGTELQLPFWLVQSISNTRPNPIIEPSLPKIYTESFRDILKADATCIDLNRLNSHYYEIGCYISKYDSKRELSETLVNAFQNRFRVILDLCEELQIDPHILDKLDSLESRLYQDAHNARLKLNKWLVESKMTMEPAKMIVNHKKRKRIHMDV